MRVSPCAQLIGARTYENNERSLLEFLDRQLHYTGDRSPSRRIRVIANSTPCDMLANSFSSIIFSRYAIDSGESVTVNEILVFPAIQYKILSKLINSDIIIQCQTRKNLVGVDENVKQRTHSERAERHRGMDDITRSSRGTRRNKESDRLDQLVVSVAGRNGKRGSGVPYGRAHEQTFKDATEYGQEADKAAGVIVHEKTVDRTLPWQVLFHPPSFIYGGEARGRVQSTLYFKGKTCTPVNYSGLRLTEGGYSS